MIVGGRLGRGKAVIDGCGALCCGLRGVGCAYHPSLFKRLDRFLLRGSWVVGLKPLFHAGFKDFQEILR